MKKTITIAIFSFFVGLANAQDYSNAVGYRFGDSRGISYKSLFNEMNGYELSLSFRQKGIQFTPTIQFYLPAQIGEDHQFFWYYGFGAHVGYQKYNVIKSTTDTTGSTTTVRDIRKKETQFVLGADVLFGLEYRILVVPFTIALEYKPYIGFFGVQNRVTNWTDLSFIIRYTIN